MPPSSNAATHASLSALPNKLDNFIGCEAKINTFDAEWRTRGLLRSENEGLSLM